MPVTRRNFPAQLMTDKSGWPLHGYRVRRRAVALSLPPVPRVRAVRSGMLGGPQAHPRGLERGRVPHELLHQAHARGGGC